MRAILLLLLIALPCAAQTRMLVLNHANEPMAWRDSKGAVSSMNNAVAYSIDNMSVPEVERRLRPMIPYKGTLIVHTIGHGMPSGQLVGLGSRRDFLNMLDRVAEDTEQEIIWWQLSCYAQAHLDQPKYITVISSSNANTPSPAYVQSGIMRKLFSALASGDPKLDPDQDGYVTVQELRNYLNSVDGARRGDLIKSPRFDKKILTTRDYHESSWIYRFRHWNRCWLECPVYCSSCSYCEEASGKPCSDTQVPGTVGKR